MLEPILPSAKTTVNEIFTQAEAHQLHAAQSSVVAVAGSPRYGQAFFAADASAVDAPVADDFNLESSIDGASMLEEIEDDDLSYPDLEMSFEPQEEDFTITDEPRAAPVSIEETHEAEQSYGFDHVEEFQEEGFNEFEQNDVAVEADAADELRFAERSQVIKQDDMIGQEAGVENGTTEQPKAAGYDSATDPWNEPLPAWEYSHNEWPVLLRAERPSAAKRLRMPIAALLIIASAAAAYFLLLQPRKDAARDESSTEAQKPLVVASPEKAEKAEAQSAPAAAPQQAPAETTASPQQQRDEAVTSPNAEGRFTLQLASMPDERAAHEAAERMKAAGLPAYVTSADLGSRGKWFRVRVGRFGSQQEAKSFASKSRLEARVERADN